MLFFVFFFFVYFQAFKSVLRTWLNPEDVHSYTVTDLTLSKLRLVKVSWPVICTEFIDGKISIGIINLHTLTPAM